MSRCITFIRYEYMPRYEDNFIELLGLVMRANTNTIFWILPGIFIHSSCNLLVHPNTICVFLKKVSWEISCNFPRKICKINFLSRPTILPFFISRERVVFAKRFLDEELKVRGVPWINEERLITRDERMDSVGTVLPRKFRFTCINYVDVKEGTNEVESQSIYELILVWIFSPRAQESCIVQKMAKIDRLLRFRIFQNLPSGLMPISRRILRAEKFKSRCIKYNKGGNNLTIKRRLFYSQFSITKIDNKTNFILIRGLHNSQ